MSVKKRTKEIVAELAPLLAALYPEKSPTEQATLLTLFATAHGGQAIVDLSRPHIDRLAQTLGYWARVRTFDWNAEWRGIEDTCAGCRDFNAVMLELRAGIKVRTDDDGRVLEPISVEDTDSQGHSLSAEFKEWIIRGRARSSSERYGPQVTPE